MPSPGRNHPGNRLAAAAADSVQKLLLLAATALAIVSLTNPAAVTANPEEIDYTCDPGLDYSPDNQCQTIQDGICDDPRHGGSGGDACIGQDCIDCNVHCKQFQADCYGCLNAKGCYYCPEDGTCENSNFYTSTNKVPACSEPDVYLSNVLGDTPDACIDADSYTQDPLWSGSEWMYDEINLVEVWEEYGLSGKGVSIRINDDGVYVNNKEFEGRFQDEENSCGYFMPNSMDQDVDGHGTAVAGIVLGNDNNDLCATGIAHEATFSSCNFFAEDVPYSAMAYKLDTFDISQNSVGMPGCGEEGQHGSRGGGPVLSKYNQVCPFEYTDSLYQPCVACDGEFIEDNTLSLSCQTAIARHCKSHYKLDRAACTDFPEIIIGGDCDFDKLPIAAIKAIELGIEEGRDGKGTIYTFASGNDFSKGDNVNFSGWTNSRYTISVGSVGKDGEHADYSTSGAGLMVSAPGGDPKDVGHLMTAGLGDEKCVDSGQGTSFACPVVTGVIALMLEANPDLTWRDVQGVLVETSRSIEDDEDLTTTVNGAGLWHSNWYGFGVIDAKAAVDAAISWEPFSEELQAIGISDEVEDVLSVDPEDEYVSKIVLDPVEDGYPDDFVAESTVILLDLAHYNRGGLQITLESPSGTTSVLTPGKRPETGALDDGERWKLMTLKNWGEDPTGKWKLKIRDLSVEENEVVNPEPDIFSQWTLIVYGRSATGQKGFGGEEDEADANLTSDLCLNPTAPSTGCLTLGDGNSSCPAGATLNFNEGSITVDANIVCPEEILIGDNMHYSEASQRGLCSCEAALFDGNCDVVHEDLECECFSCPDGLRMSTAYSCNKPIYNECLTFDCLGNCNGPYEPPLLGQPLPTGGGGTQDQPLGQPVMTPVVAPVGEPTGEQPLIPPDGQPPNGQPVSAPVLQPIGQQTPTDEGVGSEPVPPNDEPVGEPVISPDNTSAGSASDVPTLGEESEPATTCKSALPVESAATNGGNITAVSILGLEGTCLSGLETLAGWYSVVGNGKVFTLQACPRDPSKNIGISVFTGECGSLVCIENQSRQAATCESGYSTSWITENEKTYSILLTGLPVGVDLISSGRRLEAVDGPDFELEFTEEQIPENSLCGLSSSIASEGSAKGITVIGDSDYVYNTCEGTEKTGAWYSVSEGTPSEDGIIVYEASTCNSETTFYNALSIFRGDCTSLQCVDVDVLPCADNDYGQRVYWTTSKEEAFQIFVHAADTIEAALFDAGSYEIDIAFNDRQINDQCSQAIELELDAEIMGSTKGSKPDMSAISDSSCGTGSAGVWHSIVGNGGIFQASTCSNETDHKTSIYVYSGGCGSLNCIDEKGPNKSLCLDEVASDKAAVVNFKTQVDVLYHVLVSGHEEDGKESGNFGLTVTEITPSAGNECKEAVPISLDDPSTLGSTLQSTVDFSLGDVCGAPLDTPGVWYTIEGTGKGLEISTCKSNNFNTAISVFEGSCESLECVTGTQAKDAACDNSGVTAAFQSKSATTYYIFVHGTESLSSMGDFELTYKEFDVLETNEFCPQARSITADGSRIQGSTEDATHATIQETSCGVEISNPGLWYNFKGNGQPFTISACNEDADEFDVSISIFTGSCGNLKCIAGTTFFQNVCSTLETRRQLQSSTSGNNVRLMTVNLEDYYIFVHGQNGVGDFDLFVRDENLSGFGTAAPSETPIQYGTDLYRWTIIDVGIEIVTDYLKLTIVSPPNNGTASVLGPIIEYNPNSGFNGDDAMTLDGCVQSDCLRFDVIVSVMGNERTIPLSLNGSSSDDEWNKLWLLAILLVLVPCCTCIPLIYFFYQKKKRKQEENDDNNHSSDSEGFEDDFSDDDEKGERKLLSNDDDYSDDDWESSDDDESSDDNSESSFDDEDADGWGSTLPSKPKKPAVTDPNSENDWESSDSDED